MRTKKPAEGRKHTRFWVQHGAHVLLKPSGAGAGRLVNISMGGLVFEYLAEQASSIGATELDISLIDVAFELKNIPCQRVWDLPTYELLPTTPQQKRRCGVEFGQLKQSQISQLERFIQNYTTGEVV